MKKINKFLATKFDVRFNVAVQILLLAVILYVSPIAALPCILLCVISIAALLRQSGKAEALEEDFNEVADKMDEAIAAAVIYSPYPLCTIDRMGNIIWTNNRYKDVFLGGEIGETHDIYDLTGMKIHEMTNEELENKLVTVAALNKSFKVQFTAGYQISGDHEETRSIRMLHWIDVTRTQELEKVRRESMPVIAYISVDNYDDILANAPDDKKATLTGEIEKTLKQWATRCQGALIRRTAGTYFLTMDARNLEINEVNKFPILDDIRAIQTGTDIPASLSIGVGADGKTYAQTDEFANAAMDLSLGRGGDQVVVRRGMDINYYGGKLQTVEKRNKGKSRIVALAFRQLIDQSDRVFVMGHKLPDMDALGSAIGIARMAKNRGKEVNIVIDSWDAVDMMYKLEVEENEFRFIRGEYARLIISKDDIVVVCDCHKPSLVECPEILNQTDRLVIIDHHRRGEEMITGATLTYIEPYASSASELVTEMLQYTSVEKKELTKLEAESLLAGITVDTKNFTIKTGVRTFEAATWLRRQGADTTVVRQFFQTDMDLFKHKAEIISRSRRLPGDMAIAWTVDREPKNLSVLISMAADELLNIRGLRASFVLGEGSDNIIRVSARSLGDVNCQRIMENIGGGGTLTMAGAQLRDMDMQDAIDLLEKVLRDFVDEEAESGKRQKEKEKEKEKDARNQKKADRNTQALKIKGVE